MAALLPSLRQSWYRMARTSFRPLSTSAVTRGDVKNDTTALTTQTQKIEIQEQDDIAAFSGVPEEHIKTRHVKIYMPAKNAMQSGTYGTRHWRIDFDIRERWENPLMGWSSTGDPLSNVNLDFIDKEDAIAFCEKNGWEYHVDEPQKARHIKKSYGDNFSWNKKTRVSTK